jgi:histidyl-tRNA synthetase
VDKLLSPERRQAGATEKLLAILDAQTLMDLPAAAQNHPRVTEMELVLERLKNAGINNVRYDSTLMRGFDYYTGIVFEVFDLHPDNNRSMLGGGRYDGLVSLFGVEPVPTVGFGWGDVTLANFLEIHKLLPALSVETDVYVVLVGETVADAQKLISELREADLRVAVDFSGRKVGDQFKAAGKKGVAFAVVVGENEVANKMYNLKNLDSGEELQLSVKDIISALKK